ncbi:hypothetical protein [Anaerotignum sp.]
MAGKAKFYTVKMTNGDIYGIPAQVIAENYAKYFKGKNEKIYQEQYDCMMEMFDRKEYAFEDWARNEMNWDDVKDKAVLLRRCEVKVDFQECWINGDHGFLEVDVD